MVEVAKLIESVLPVTALCAIVLFAVKEVLELQKKNREKKRKLAAYKLLLAEEIMKNAFTIQTLRGYFRFVLDGSFRTLEIKKHESGFVSVACIRQDGGGGGGSLPLVHTAFFDKSIVELAVLDMNFFMAANVSYESLADVENCREQLVRYVSESDMETLQRLSWYALEKIDDADEKVKKLYRFCSDGEMKVKVRSFLK